MPPICQYFKPKSTEVITIGRSLVLNCLYHIKEVLLKIFFLPTVPVLRPGNIVYSLLFGWWIAVIYIVIGGLMFVTYIGKPYGMYEYRIGPRRGIGLGLTDL